MFGPLKCNLVGFCELLLVDLVNSAKGLYIASTTVGIVSLFVLRKQHNHHSHQFFWQVIPQPFGSKGLAFETLDSAFDTWRDTSAELVDANLDHGQAELERQPQDRLWQLLEY